MKTPRTTIAGPQANEGIALVIILAFIVLLTGLVMAFFSRALTESQVSNSSANQTKADILARSAIGVIIGDLKQEIVDGSTVATPSPAPEAGVVYVPKTNLDMKPRRDAAVLALSGSDTIPNLLRVSSPSAPASPMAATGIASNVSSTGTSANGRSINPERWNSHYLIPRKNAGSASIDSIPIDSFETVAPSWVMVTTQGPQVLASATNTVIGRYAYAIYDESMLLDLNVAGYPSSTSKTQAGLKPSLAYADLTQIGILNSGSDHQVDNIVGWRNYTVLQPPADQTLSGNYDFHSLLTTGTHYNQFVLSATNGFLTTSGTVYNNRTDQMFTSRQTLLKFRRATGFSQDALQYLGTFSRSITSPSWTPAAPASSTAGTSTIDYAAIADDPDSPNRNLLNVRFLKSGNVTHYNDDGTSSTYPVQSGDPLVQRRFSLAKLAWLGHNGPDASKFAASVTSAQQKQAITDCFGLQWDSTHQCWVYNHANTSDPRSPNNILKLDEIAKLNTPREPDFFELLKAGILQGSLGGQPGSVAPGLTSATEGPSGLSFEYYSIQKDRHIRQIGANIIDQADSDNYPTAIYQNLDVDFISPYGEKDLFNTVFGIENLPMLSRICVVSYKEDSTTAGMEDFWLEPEVWNPHDSSTADATKYPETPAHLRMVTYGGCEIKMTEDDGYAYHSKTMTNGPFSASIDFGTDPTHPKLDGIVSFVNPQPNIKKPYPFFDHPVNLTGYGPSTTSYQDTTQASGPKNYLIYRTGGSTAKARLLGVWLGELPRDPVTYPTHTIEVLPISSPSEPQLTFVLEYLDANNKWLPYSIMARVQELLSPPYKHSQANGYITPFGMFSSAQPDPRTNRFSSFGGKINSSGTTYNYTWSLGTTIQSGTIRTSVPDGGGRGSLSFMMPDATKGFFYRNPITNSFSTAYLLDDWAQNKAIEDSDPHFWYQDPDGIVRPGDSWRADYATGDGVMLYHPIDVKSLAPLLPNSVPRRRPIILNRPFRSVGELGYVHRDLPFKTLDFWSSLSADSGLLDLFSVTDQPTIVAGQISPSAAPPVLQAVIGGAMKQENPNQVTSSGNEAAAVAQAIADETSANGPLTNPADLVTRLSDPVYNALTTFAASNTASDPKPNSNKIYGETPLRALAPVTNTRTWNLMIDVVAQSGRMTANAQTLNDFIVEGERRYWLHVAIDRYTGKIIDQQLEPVYE